MTRKLLLCLLLFIPSAASGSNEHDACKVSAYDWFDYSADEMRQIAQSCHAPLFAELNYHRAYYKDLVNENAVTSTLIYHFRSHTDANITARLFNMVLVEQLTPYYHKTNLEQVRYLNTTYELNNQIAELKLRGYANLAERLNRLESGIQ